MSFLPNHHFNLDVDFFKSGRVILPNSTQSNTLCYFLNGRQFKQVLAEQKPKYIIRDDIKSYYKSIQHHLLIQDVKRYYSDPNVQSMLENIILNPIETPRGYKNADNGIALRGPLSQFFSALYYLEP